MTRRIISRKALEFLNDHLEKLEDQKKQILEEYYPTPSPGRQEFEQLTKEYMEYMNQFIRTSQISEMEDKHFPIVIIGSEVEVEEASGGENYRLRIVAPFSKESPHEEVEYASCLSPVGRALLLKKVNDRVSVHTPSRTFHYTIKSISVS